MVKCNKLTPEDRHAIQVLKGCVPYSVLMKKYNISKSTIYYIQNLDRNGTKESKKRYYQKNADKYREISKINRYRRAYGLEDISQLKALQVWENELGEKVILLKGVKEGDRYNCYDAKGNLRNQLKLTEKVCDLKELFDVKCGNKG